MHKKILFVFTICFLLIPFSLKSQYIYSEDEGDYYIRDIIIERDSVFMRSDNDWFFAAKAANAMHSLTRRYVIEDELLFTANAVTTEEALAETERNLRKTELFTHVKIELDSVDVGTFDAYVLTKDRWSLYPEPKIGSGGGDLTLGLGIEEFNVAGTGTMLMGEVLHIGENDIGWQFNGILEQPRLFRSEIGLLADVKFDRFRTEQTYELEKKYRTLSTPSSYGITVINNDGTRFNYIGEGEFTELNTTERRATAFYSHGWERQNRYFATAMVEVEDIERPDPQYARAFDNSAKILVQFSSTFHKYAKISNITNYFEEDIESGGYGRVIVGRTMPMDMRTADSLKDQSNNLYYVAGEGEQSYYNGKFYIFGGVKGASGFQNGYARYTYEEINFKTFYQFNKVFTLAANVRQQTVWNWYRDRQLLLDHETGLRGYASNTLKGDNRIIGNFEARIFPGWHWWVLDFSTVAFWDIGTVWDETIKLQKARWHNSVGLGIRAHFSKSASPSHTTRLDFAYNFDTKSFGAVMFSSEQYFDTHKEHDYRKPHVFGIEYDE
jgi:outer membrane protein assembly factor BamA